MAKPLAGAGAIQLLEDTVHALRQAPLSTVICHWMGSAPFALAALLFRNDVTTPRTPDTRCALDALVLALLLVWMNCWRAVFSGRLRRQLSGAPDSPWSGRRVWNLVSNQAFLAATKLVMWPVALLIAFPFASVAAFHRYAAVFADREGLDPIERISKARQLSGRRKGQSWALLPFLIFLGLAVWGNVAITLATLPFLVRMLTGYESVFSRGEVYFVMNQMFLLATLSITWMAFDPFVQAVYTVRCFRAESEETGEDLRAGLRAMRRARQAAVAAVGIAVVGLAIQPAAAFQAAPPGKVRVLARGERRLKAGGDQDWLPHNEAAIPPSDIEQSVKLAVQAHEYDWRLPPPPGPAPRGSSWLVRVTDRITNGLRSVLRKAGQAIRDFFDWLGKKLGSGPPQPKGAPPAAGLHWSLSLLMAAILGLAAWMAWTRRWFRRAAVRAVGAASGVAVRLDAADLAPDLLPEERWLELAERCLRDENFCFALRAFYLASLAWLGRGEFLLIHAGKTNREYELELRRRARAFPEAPGLFALSVAAFERAWYGLHEVTGEDVRQFRDRVDHLKALLAQPAGVPA